MTEPARRSPIALRIAIGERILDQALAGGRCPLCGYLAGDHRPDCLVGLAILNDPAMARRARAAKEGRRG